MARYPGTVCSYFLSDTRIYALVHTVFAHKRIEWTHNYTTLFDIQAQAAPLSLAAAPTSPFLPPLACPLLPPTLLGYPLADIHVFTNMVAHRPHQLL